MPELQSSDPCSSSPQDGQGNCGCWLCSGIRGEHFFNFLHLQLTCACLYFLLDIIQWIPEIRVEILRIIMRIVDVHSLRALRVYSETRPLWSRQTGVRLPADLRKHSDFCQDVLTFQIGRLSRHPSIIFGNVSVLQLSIFPGKKKLIRQFKEVLSYLRINDLCVYCGEVPSFMETALKVWAPSLQTLTILRIAFDRYSWKVRVRLQYFRVISK